MPEIIETIVYRLDELSDAAKDAARGWYREGGFDYDWFEFVYDDFERICAILGISLRTRPVRLFDGGTRSKPCIWFWASGARAMGPASRATTSIRDPPYAASGLMHQRIPRFTGSPTPSRPFSGATSTNSGPP